jgi:L-alanine-DL-glutamate epimerase-like enolase superfamily enzyme
VRAAAPQSELIVDANEGWTAGNPRDEPDCLREAGVTLVEQPLPSDADATLGVD